MKRIVLLAIGVAAFGAAIAANLGDIRRYLNMRRM